MIRAYKKPNAIDFGDGKALGDVGLDKPAATVTFTLEDGAKRVLDVGATAEGSNRWARDPERAGLHCHELRRQLGGLAGLKKFQSEKKDTCKSKSSSDSSPSPGMPDNE
jgi:hypothetical protein